MTNLQFYLNQTKISNEYLAGYCGVKVKDIENWLAAGVVPELYAPTLSTLLSVPINLLYGEHRELKATATMTLTIDDPIVMTNEVGKI